MKVGDLVRLSAYGLARDYNNQITLKDPDQVGLVVDVMQRNSYPYTVKWVKGFKCVSHGRRELKHV